MQNVVSTSYFDTFAPVTKITSIKLLIEVLLYRPGCCTVENRLATSDQYKHTYGEGIPCGRSSNILNIHDKREGDILSLKSDLLCRATQHAGPTWHHIISLYDSVSVPIDSPQGPTYWNVIV